MNTKHRLGTNTITFDGNVKVIGSACIVGKKEGEGPLASTFDKIVSNAYFEKDSWEQAEGELQRQCAELLLDKICLKDTDIDIVFAGDLLDQCVGSMQGVMQAGKSFVGLFGACSTFAEAIILSSMAVNDGFASRVMAITSSHFCSAEKQFRFPLEYGSQRPQTSQWTVTGSGAFVIEGNAGDLGVFITKATIGKPIEMGITDPNNMGAAMAPAAANTIKCFLQDTGTKPSDYDLIMTGDLGVEGSRLLKELLMEDNIDIASVHNDGGLMIFDLDKQDVHAGGSGCGCSATVMAGKIMTELSQKKLKKVLYAATGALMSASTALQKMPIVGISHLVELEAR